MDGIDTLKARYLAAVAGAADEAGLEEVRVGALGKKGDQPWRIGIQHPRQPAPLATLPLYDGELGVAPGHTPMIGRLGYGELRIVFEGQTARFYVDGGFAGG